MAVFGAHMSVSGGLHLAFDRLESIGGKALQIFTANQRQWHPKLPSEKDVSLFRDRHRLAGKIPVAAHDSYLINLASPKTETSSKSVNAFADEMKRCAALGVEYLVMHPGSHLGEGIDKGLSLFTANLDLALSQADIGDKVTVLLETTAGQGTSIGARFDELAKIIAASSFQQQLGVCYDTCHSFVAGYDIRSPETYRKTMDTFDSVIGLDRLKLFHLNDAKKELGSRVDRHTHIGQGFIGVEGFKNLVNDPFFANHPMVLETPKSGDLHEDRENIEMLKSLLS